MCDTKYRNSGKKKNVERGVVRHMVNTSTYTPTYAKQITVYFKMNVEGTDGSPTFIHVVLNYDITPVNKILDDTEQ